MAATNETALGLTAADMTALTNAQTSFASNLAQHILQQGIAKAWTTNKNVQLKQSQDVFRTYVAKIQITPTVGDGLREQLGITVKKSPTKRIPLPPANVDARILSSGQIAEIRWKSGGNVYPTIYVVEQRIGSGEWTQAELSTRRRAQVPITSPEPMTFRVYAQRDGLVSVFSQEITIFGGVVTTAPALQMAA